LRLATKQPRPTGRSRAPRGHSGHLRDDPYVLHHRVAKPPVTTKKKVNGVVYVCSNRTRRVGRWHDRPPPPNHAVRRRHRVFLPSRAPQPSYPAPAWQTAVACTGPGHPPSMPRRCVRGSPSSIVLLLPGFTFVFFFSVRAESSRLFLHFIHRCKRHRPSFFLTLPLSIRACFSSGCAVAA
jgi:hypothetical protein